MRGIASAVALLVTFISAPAQTAVAPASESGLKILSFNIRYGLADDGRDSWAFRRDLVARVILQERPDLVGLQEALKFQLDDLKAALKGYEVLGVGRDDGKKAGEYSAILYREDRLRALAQGTFWLSGTPEVAGSMTWGNRLPRICTWAEFEDRAAGKRFLHMNTHFDHQSQPSREKAAELIVRWLAQREEPLPAVLTGDLNAGESNPVVQHLLGISVSAIDADPGPFSDTFRTLHPDRTDVATFNGFGKSPGTEKIDFVLTTRGFETLQAEILDISFEGRFPSDHDPVSATVRLSP